MRTFGVEIECILRPGMTRSQLAAHISAAGIQCREESLNHRVPTMWKTTTDGSIGYENTEVVSPPLSGEAGLREIDTVCTVLAQHGCSINRNCGLHVHVDARRPQPLDIAALKRLALLYIHNEPFIDTVQPPSRRGLHPQYCQGVANVNPELVMRCTDANELATVLKFNRMPRAREVFGYGHSDPRRYVKFNVTATWMHGTVEFRAFAGTTEAKKIRVWVNLCQAMVEDAFTDTDTPTLATVTRQQAIMGRAARSGTRNELICNMLLRPNQGATMQELLAATATMGTRWKAINIPRVATQYGLGLTTGRVRDPITNRRVTRYFGARLPVVTIDANATDAPASTPAPARIKPSNIVEFIERLGLSPADRDFLLERQAMFAQPTLNIVRPE